MCKTDFDYRTESVLHPAFEEDEILLILVGGILGLLAGALQLLIFYS